MTTFVSRFAAAGFVALSVVALPSFAAAQPCGDPDGSGAVTVSDGVNVLREAAGLTSSCGSHVTRCDVDGNGNVSVTDGVNVLRSAAGLDATSQCPTVNAVARFAGRYQGTFSGDDEGDFDVEVDCSGDIEGVGHSSFYDEDFDVFGAVTESGDVTITGGTSSVSTFRGTMREDGSVSGSWSNASEGTDGSFRGSRTSGGSCAAVGAP